MLEDFQTGTASMARKRHLASTARGFYGICLMAHRTVATHSTPLPGGQYARGQGFIYVYRLAIDAKTRKGDDVGG